MRTTRLIALALLLAGCGPTRRGVTPQEDLAGAPPEDAGAEGEDLAGQPPRDFAGVGQDAVAQGCGGPLVVKPADLVMLVDGVHAFKATYLALCGKNDVSANATFTVDDPKLGAFAGAVFTSAPGAAGMTTVRAALGASKGQTSLTLKVTTVVIAPNTPQDAPMKFGGGNDPNLAPQWVYPDDGVLVPPNLSELELQFLPKGGNLFELAFSGGGVNLKVYTVCSPVGNGCAFELDEPTWILVSQVARGKTVTVTLRGTAGGGVGTSAPRRISFADEDLVGGLYYWAASPGGIFRYDFGLRGQKAEAFYNNQQAGAMCVGCHALSRNGRRIAVGLNIPGPATMRVLDVATKMKTYELGGGFGSGSNYEALTHDGAKLVTTEKGGLTLRDAANGALIGANPQVPNANMPDFNADDTQVVFARGSQNPCQFGICNTLSTTDAGLFTVSFANNAFGAPKAIVPLAPGQNNYYPAFSPDGKWVAFNRSAGDGFDAKDARLMAVAATGGKVIDFAALNAGGANSWPKFAPFTHHFGGGTVLWLTFSTRRAYGLRGGTNSQIWMVGIDPGKLGAGSDGAYPAFWLPFQDPATGNHIPQFAEKVDRPPCSDIDNTGCGPDEICVNGGCQPGIK